MIENEQEIGLEISLTTYDEGFEAYQHQSWRQEQEPIVEANKTENDTAMEQSTSAPAKEHQRLPEKPSPSTDSTNDTSFSVSSLEASIDDHNERHKVVPTVDLSHRVVPTIDLSSLSAVSSSDVFDEEVAVLTASNSRLNHPDLPTHKEEEEEERDLDEQARDVTDTTFLARLYKSRAYLEDFPSTVQDLNSKINDLLEDLRDREKRCQAAEAELALVKHEACLQSEEYRILYGRAKEEQVKAAKECKAKAAQIADLEADRDTLARIMQDPESARTAQEKEIQRLRNELAASQVEAVQCQRERDRQAVEIEKLRHDLQETKRAHQTQLGARTAALEEERRRNQQLQEAEDALIKQVEAIKAEHIKLKAEHDKNLTAMMEQSQTVEELTMEIGEWRIRAEQSVSETTRLSRENASLTAHQDHVTSRAKAEVDQAQAELQFSQAHWEAKLAAALSNNEQVQGQLLFFEKLTEELKADLEEWKSRANEDGTKVVSLTEKLELREEQLQTVRAHTEVLNSKVELLEGTRDEISLELEQSRNRIKTLEALGPAAAAETCEVRIAQQESTVVKAITAKLKDTTKRRRGILAMHRNKNMF